MTRTDWSIAFIRRVGELRPGMGQKYMATIVATLWPKHRDDDPDQVAVRWVADREASE